MKLPNAEQMRNLDEVAINDYGIPGIVLMENAGRGAVEATARRYGTLRNENIVIIVGPGNNGGDGFVMARHLHQLGAKPTVFLLVAPEKLKGDAATNAEIVKKIPVPVHSITSVEAIEEVQFRKYLADCKIIVDAIFGTGLKRDVTGFFADIIRAINNSSRPVVAVDIPSGLDSDTGRQLGVCVAADLTVTLGLAKPGLVVQPGALFCGTLEVVDIGIPHEAVEGADIKLELLEARQICEWLPKRDAASHKGTFGHMMIIAGSKGKTGAALLSTKGGLRSGVGLVTLCAPQEIHGVFESVSEAMTVPLPKSKVGHLVIEDYLIIKEAAKGKRSIVVGPGLGTLPDTAEIIERLYAEIDAPMVIDADGLNILAEDVSVLKVPEATRILTPHPGEMARLAGIKTEEVQAGRYAAAAEFAQRHNVYVVLKGAGTVVAAPDGRVALNPTGNPGMATGGMGDVLAGLIGGLLAQGVQPWEAACGGVFLHGLAADRIAACRGADIGIMASEVADELPLAFKELNSVNTIDR